VDLEENSQLDTLGEDIHMIVCKGVIGFYHSGIQVQAYIYATYVLNVSVGVE